MMPLCFLQTVRPAWGASSSVRHFCPSPKKKEVITYTIRERLPVLQKTETIYRWEEIPQWPRTDAEASRALFMHHNLFLSFYGTVDSINIKDHDRTLPPLLRAAKPVRYYDRRSGYNWVDGSESTIGPPIREILGWKFLLSSPKYVRIQIKN